MRSSSLYDKNEVQINNIDKKTNFECKTNIWMSACHNLFLSTYVCCYVRQNFKFVNAKDIFSKSDTVIYLFQ